MTDNPTPPRAANNRANAPRPTPVWTCTIVLNTDFAQRVYKRAWDRLKADLYVLTVRTRSSGMDEAARAIEAMISEGFESARKDLTAELARSEALMDSVKLTELPVYKGAQTIQAEYSTPRAKEFLNLLTQMDQLLMRYDALWLNAHIETQPRVQRSQNWQRRLIKTANRLRELGNRTRAGLTREAERRTGKAAPAAAGQEAAAAPRAASTEEVLDQMEEVAAGDDAQDLESSETGALDESADVEVEAEGDMDAELAEIEVQALVPEDAASEVIASVSADSTSLETQEDTTPPRKTRRRAALAATG
jgi:hypothetical protein